LAASRNWRSRLIPVVTVLAISTSTGSCKLPGDLRALSRSTTALTETLREEIPPLSEAWTETARAVSGAAGAVQAGEQSRKALQDSGADLLKQVGAYLIAGAALLFTSLKTVRRWLAKRANGGTSPPASSSSP